MKKFIIGGALLAVVVLGFVFWPHSKQPAPSSQNPADFPLLSKRIFVDDPNEPIINFTPLRKSLQNYYQDNNLTGSLYFEYLPTGTSIRITGDNREVAASLIKLPVAMELYRASEMGKVNLDTDVELQQAWLNDKFGTLYQKGAGYKLSLREATKIMLSESDNTALAAIAHSVEGLVPVEENPFEFLDADFQQNDDLTISISARSYSSFLKCLYFSCYLEKQHSQELLHYLTQSDFNSRLAAGVDDDVTIAHKVGNFGDTTQSDCGIVYLDKKNYLLCAMVDGSDNPTTDSHLAELSRITYNFVKDSSSGHK